MGGKHLIVVTGPTASGKSALAVSLARHLSTEIISADSRQIFRGIPIVTAVPTEEEKEGVPHHLIEMLPLDAYYNAWLFRKDTLRIAERIWEHNDYAIVCGGSMLYVDALCNGIDDLPDIDAEIRNSLKLKHESLGDEWLLSELEQADPVTFSRIDRKNIKRVFHALELSVMAGRPYSELLGVRRSGSSGRPDCEIHKFVLDMPREILFGRINSRVVRMVAAGLEEEARSVLHLRHLNSLNTVGLKEMFAWFDGIMDFETAVSRIQKNTRVYAKKQLTWFRRDSSAITIDGCNNPLRQILDCI